jgi:hypothetical protein
VLPAVAFDFLPKFVAFLLSLFAVRALFADDDADAR